MDAYLRAVAVDEFVEPEVKGPLAEAKEAVAEVNGRPAQPWVEAMRRAHKAKLARRWKEEAAAFEEAFSTIDPRLVEDKRAKRVIVDAHVDAARANAHLWSGYASPEDHDVTGDEATRACDLAFRHLNAAIGVGIWYQDEDKVLEDAELAPLHGDVRWKEFQHWLEK